MKFTDKNKIRRYIELVDSSAPVKAYRDLGLDRTGIKAHLPYLADYRKVLLEESRPKESVKSELDRALDEIANMVQPPDDEYDGVEELLSDDEVKEWEKRSKKKKSD